MIKFRPLHDRVVIRRSKPDNVSAGGIVIPETAQKKTNEGFVVAKGPGKLLKNGTRRAIDVEVGDLVSFDKNSAHTIEINKETLLIVNEDDVAAVLPNQF